jgi:S-adenosylmethionine decarboxylase
MGRKIKLQNFNNLSKNLNISFYDINYSTDDDKIACNNYLHKKYNSERLVEILKEICEKIGASILNISKQDYEPIGSSVNFLITEEPVSKKLVDRSCNLGHLDKSHIAVHTYPEYSSKTNISTIRVDINVSTCGLISPLKCLNYLLSKFSLNNSSDVVQINYFIHGFTRTTQNKKIFIDHKPLPITCFISKKYLRNYHNYCENFEKHNIWICKLVIKKIIPKEYFFNKKEKKIKRNEKNKIIRVITKEISEIAQQKNY